MDKSLYERSPTQQDMLSQAFDALGVRREEALEAKQSFRIWVKNEEDAPKSTDLFTLVVHNKKIVSFQTDLIKNDGNMQSGLVARKFLKLLVMQGRKSINFP